MKLFIDDIRNAPGDKWSVARTVSQAISFIATFGLEIEEISIDHDISHQVGMGSLTRPFPCEETFLPVAYFIGEYYSNRKAVARFFPRIVIHSSNHSGADKIKSVLEHYAFKNITIEMRGAANRLEMEI